MYIHYYTPYTSNDDSACARVRVRAHVRAPVRARVCVCACVPACVPACGRAGDIVRLIAVLTTLLQSCRSVSVLTTAPLATRR